MKSVKLAAISILTSTMLLSSLSSGQAVSAKEAEQTVRVGLYYSIPGRDTRVFSAHNHSDSGFEIGYSENGSFVRLFVMDNKDFVIAPSGNLYAKMTDAKTVNSGTGGVVSFGGYHVQLAGGHSSYASALSVAAHYKSAFIAYTAGMFTVRLGMFSTKAEASEAAVKYSGSSVHSPAADGISLLDVASGAILFEYDGNKKPLALRAQKNGTVTLPVISGSNYAYYSYYGFFEYGVSDKKLTMVNCIDLEKYVKSVMANEVGVNASDEVTKAFSILIRTVPLNNTKHSANGFGVCNQSCCQVYKGTFRQSARNDSIVDSTKGIVVTYDGQPISCLYNYSNGGASCSSSAAWGNNPVPYLTSVFLEEPLSEAVTWQHSFDEAELYRYLKSRSSFSTLQGGISKVEISATDPLGSSYVTALAVTDLYGNTVTVHTSSAVRSTMDFDSANFIIEYALRTTVQSAEGYEIKDATAVMTAYGIKNFSSLDETYKVLTAKGETSITADLIVFDGKGKGHGVGYSQVGAEALVLQGYDYAYTLSFFFPGTVLTRINE